MRVIAGSARRIPLKTVKGDDVRPTTDRIKETLFNILQPEIPGCRFLDLFAGSGGIGIEALSRGAERAVFADRNREAVRCIRENLAHTKLAERAEVLQGDALSVLRQLEARREAFDLVFLDPPYASGVLEEALAVLAGSSLLAEGALIVAETGLGRDLTFLAPLALAAVREKRYKTNQHIFIRKKKETAHEQG